jgi:uracil-DNA glycosylase
MESILTEIHDCRVCAASLPHGCRPIVQASSESQILIIGQAPGRRVFETGIPWNDPSGDALRLWLGVEKSQFYDPKIFALMPMGFCYPGAGKSGDLPPRAECAPLWHERLLANMPNLRLTLLIGQYAQNHYLRNATGKNLTETVQNWQTYLPQYLVLPHPSPRNRIWMSKNTWFASDVLPVLRALVLEIV